MPALLASVGRQGCCTYGEIDINNFNINSYKLTLVLFSLYTSPVIWSVEK
jgi:hypothetical protein